MSSGEDTITAVQEPHWWGLSCVYSCAEDGEDSGTMAFAFVHESNEWARAESARAS